MSRRRKHQYVQVCTFTCTEKEAEAAHDPSTASSSVLTPERALAAWVICRVCEGDWPAVHGSFCPGSPTVSLVSPASLASESPA